VKIADGARASAGGPDHLHPQRPQHRGGRAWPDPGQRRPAPHRGRHHRRAAGPPGPGRRPGHRAAPLDRPTLRVQCLPECRTGLCGHRPRGPEPYRDRRPGRDHRDRGPPARLRRPVPRHRDQPRLRVHPLAQDRRPRPPARARPPRSPATTATPPAPAARPLPPPPRQRRRSPCWPGCWTATASSNPPPAPATRPWPTPTTWPSCTRSGPPRPPRPGTSGTATC
jgi:hypothetical protein